MTVILTNFNNLCCYETIETTHLLIVNSGMGPKKKGKKGKKNDKVIPDTPDDDFEQKDPETLLQEEFTLILICID